MAPRETSESCSPAKTVSSSGCSPSSASSQQSHSPSYTSSPGAGSIACVLQMPPSVGEGGTRLGWCVWARGRPRRGRVKGGERNVRRAAGCVRTASGRERVHVRAAGRAHTGAGES
eukprot:1023156-Prymnesium_polylepis.1